MKKLKANMWILRAVIYCVVVFVCYALAGCSSDEPDAPTPMRVSIDPTHLEMRVGETAIVTIEGVRESVTAVAEQPELAVTEVVEPTSSKGVRQVRVSASLPGSTRIVIDVDGAKHFIPLLIEEPTEPLSHLSDAELADATPRCVGAGLDLRLGTPGVMVKTDHRNGEYVFIDITSGRRVVFTADHRLLIDGSGFPLACAVAEQQSISTDNTRGATTWWHLVTSPDARDIVLVTADYRK